MRRLLGGNHNYDHKEYNIMFRGTIHYLPGCIRMLLPEYMCGVHCWRVPVHLSTFSEAIGYSGVDRRVHSSLMHLTSPETITKEGLQWTD